MQDMSGCHHIAFTTTFLALMHLATPYKRIMTFIFIFKQLHGWTIETILQHRPVVVLKNVWI